MRTLNDLFEETLKDVYFAENAILKALPKMAQKASSKDLKAAFTEHAQETEGQVKRLDKVFKLIGSLRAKNARPSKDWCKRPKS